MKFQTSHVRHIRLILLLVFVSDLLIGQEQRPPFWNDIREFNKQDSIQPPPKHAILFVGSSSFTKWTDVQSYFSSYTIINRGFGGSSLTDLIRYRDDVILKYAPKQIVIYCGENDLAASDTVTAEMVYKRFTTLFALIRKGLPGVPIVFISLKPSPSRWHLRQKMMTANDRIKNFLSGQKKTAFIDVYHEMLGSNDLPLREIYLEDSLHMNSKGYAIWKKAIEPELLK